MALFPPLPNSCKAIVLFTPGGDVIYTVDVNKARHWHFDLCVGLQSLFGLKEPPQFLVPAYTATLDMHMDHDTQDTHVVAEAFPAAYRYRYFLNSLFNLTQVTWTPIPWSERTTNPWVLHHYHGQFPELWQNHNLVVALDQVATIVQSLAQPAYSSINMFSKLPDPTPSPPPDPDSARGYVFRLYVSGHGMQTEQSLKRLHRFLNEGLSAPYSLKVIDIKRYPDRAEQDQVTAVPTLVRIWPQPVRRIVGHFKDPHQLIQLLTVHDNLLELLER